MCWFVLYSNTRGAILEDSPGPNTKQAGGGLLHSNLCYPQNRKRLWAGALWQSATLRTEPHMTPNKIDTHHGKCRQKVFLYIYIQSTLSCQWKHDWIKFQVYWYVTKCLQVYITISCVELHSILYFYVSYIENFTVGISPNQLLYLLYIFIYLYIYIYLFIYSLAL